MIEKPDKKRRVNDCLHTSLETDINIQKDKEDIKTVKNDTYKT